MIRPITLRAAGEFVRAVHRHHAPPQGGLFAAALYDGETLLGVAIAGRPVARALDDGLTIEVTRVAVTEGSRNACSQLYGAICRAAAALGYTRAITYTLASEVGSSCKAAGFVCEGEAGGGRWKRSERDQVSLFDIAPSYPIEEKRRWVRSL